MGNYIDNVVLKLQRKHSKDELVAHLNKQIEELKQENSELRITQGKDLSYIQELEYKLSQPTMKNGGEQWFKKYSEIKEKYNQLLVLSQEPTKKLQDKYRNLLERYNELRSKKNRICRE